VHSSLKTARGGQNYKWPNRAPLTKRNRREKKIVMGFSIPESGKKGGIPLGQNGGSSNIKDKDAPRRKEGLSRERLLIRSGTQQEKWGFSRE